MFRAAARLLRRPCGRLFSTAQNPQPSQTPKSSESSQTRSKKLSPLGWAGVGLATALSLYGCYFLTNNRKSPSILRQFSAAASSSLKAASSSTDSKELTPKEHPKEEAPQKGKKDEETLTARDLQLLGRKKGDFDPKDFSEMKIFSGRANEPLAREIADYLGIPLGNAKLHSYADGEIGIQVNENIRGKDIYIVQPTCPPGVNDNLIELLLMISTMRRASASRITAVLPYYGYARADRKMQARVPISAADVARLIESMGADRVIAVDLHCGQIQGFFSPSTPCDNLDGHIIAVPYFQNLGLKSETTVVVSPDAGGVYRAKQFRDSLKLHGVDAGMAMIIKQRVRANEVGKMDLVGQVKGMDCIMVDDMIDTAGTLTHAATELKQAGAKRVFAFASHGLFSHPAYERIAKSDLEQVVVCNTIPLRKSTTSPEKIVQISIAPLLAEAIARVHTRKSVSELFLPNSIK
eukprot:TRINITY_DN5470_c0_g1_i1.p1 TRINITY_DN5470_c0_g1~~TRINITY_DN5470_c0_g1_i1.p1  ORF type:complete len:465 (-),score=86.95 TRINITY_DN5470_c0_g1_i1:194-1588(-)